MLHTCNICTFEIVAGLSLIRLLANWCDNHKIVSIIIHSIHWLLQSQCYSKIAGILWEVLSVSTAQIHKNSMFTLDFKNAPMKYNWCTLDLCFEETAKKYFRVLVNAVGYHVSPIISLLWKYHLNTIIKFNLSIIQSYWVFLLYTPMHGFSWYPFYGSSIIKVCLLIKFLVLLKVSFKQAFLASAGNLVTSEKSWVL